MKPEYTQRQLINNTLAGEAALVAQAIAHGVDPDVRDEEHGETALMLALQLGRDAVVETLLAAGADVNARDVKGRTPIMVAGGPVMEKLANLGADLNACDNEGKTALMHAVRRADIHKCVWLITHGAETSTQDECGDTAHSLASEMGLVAVKELLSGR